MKRGEKEEDERFGRRMRSERVIRSGGREDERRGRRRMRERVIR